MRSQLLQRLIYVALVMAFVGGCAAPVAPAAPAASSSGGAAAPSAGKTTITFWTWQRDEWLQKIVDELNQNSTSYSIELNNQFDPGDYQPKVLTAFAAGTAPDLMWVTPGQLQEFGRRNTLLDLGACLSTQSDPVADLNDYIDIAVKAFSIQGTPYALAWSAEPLMLYANQPLIEEYGYNSDVYNWSWDNVWEINEGISDGVDRYGFISVGGFHPIPSAPDHSPEEISEWRERFDGGTVSLITDWAGVNHEFADQTPTPANAFPLPVDANGRRHAPLWLAGTAISSATRDPEIACQALIDLTAALQNVYAFPPRRSLFQDRQAAADRITSFLPYKTALSAENIVTSMAETVAGDNTSTIIYEPYPSPPSSEEIGEATLVPNDPQILSAILGLNNVLVENGATINVARSVVLDVVHLAPIGSVNAPQNEEEFWQQVEEKNGLIIGVLVRGGASQPYFAIRVQPDKSLNLINPDGGVEVAEGEISESESVSIPTAGITHSIYLCKVKLDSVLVISLCYQ